MSRSWAGPGHNVANGPCPASESGAVLESGMASAREAVVAREAGAESLQAHPGLGLGDSGRDDGKEVRRVDSLGEHTLYYDDLWSNVHFAI